MSLLFHSIPRQPLQSDAVGLPDGVAIRRYAAVVVQVDAFGVRAAPARQGLDLPGAQGPREMKSAWMGVVVNPFVACDPKGFVPPVQKQVTTVL
jgi:hypothetical protein